MGEGSFALIDFLPFALLPALIVLFLVLWCVALTSITRSERTGAQKWLCRGLVVLFPPAALWFGWHRQAPTTYRAFLLLMLFACLYYFKGAYR